MYFILFIELLTYHAAKQQNLVSCQVRSPRAVVRFMRGLETGVGAVTETYSSLEKVGQHDCGGPGDDMESLPRLGRNTSYKVYTGCYA
jgi:hypothetical protein